MSTEIIVHGYQLLILKQADNNYPRSFAKIILSNIYKYNALDYLYISYVCIATKILHKLQLYILKNKQFLRYKKPREAKAGSIVFPSHD